VLPGTHKLGRLTAAQIAEEQQARTSVACVVRAGDVLLMRPLVVHASSAASRAAHRRVIHIDYASCGLDGSLRWADGAYSY
jgi:ectoine hydroxylase-related dioxygenase (phytanoyl-CoA dioxygenase family)